MKTLPSGLQDQLDSRATTLVFCWKITLTNGTVKGFTDHDEDIVFDSVTYVASTGFSPTTVKSVIGGGVDDMDVIGFLDAAAIEDDDILNRLYDSAAVDVFRVDWNDTANRVMLFRGKLGTITRGPYSFRSEVRSLRQLLLQPQGNTYKARCNATLGDAKCGIDLTSGSYTITGTVASTTDSRIITTTTSDIFSKAANWFTGGLLTWTSGDNIGASSEVKKHLKESTTALLETWESMQKPIQIGDAFKVSLGCDKLITTCKNKFDNVECFRGFPRMPQTDIAVQVATSTSAFFNASNEGSWYK